MLWSLYAWRDVTETTMRNCWRKSGILGVLHDADVVGSDARVHTRISAEYEADMEAIQCDKWFANAATIHC
jgi:hypothetical protein